MNAFFRRAGVATLTARELFDFAVDPNINDANIDQAIDALIGVASSRPFDLDPDEVIAEKVQPQVSNGPLARQLVQHLAIAIICLGGGWLAQVWIQVPVASGSELHHHCSKSCA
jgi:cytochrome c biogenesis protein ResB